MVEISLIVGSTDTITYSLPLARSTDITFNVNATVKSEDEASNKNYEIAKSISQGDIVLTATVQAALTGGYLIDSNTGTKKRR